MTMIRNMKRFQNTFFFAFLLLAAFFMTRCSEAGAASSIKPVNRLMDATVLVYEQALNPSIGITADNSAVGSSYTITNAEGRVILTGTIRSGKTFHIPTGKLGKGAYRFQVGDRVLQQFVIR